MELTDYDVLTFDCYGTLIDWDTGIYNELRPWLERFEINAGRDEVLDAFARYESRQQAATPTMLYSQLLAEVYKALAQHWTLPVDEDAASAFGRSVKDWPPFPDSAEALRSGALSDPSVGRFLSRRFVAAWTQVGTFTIYQDKDRMILKAGGNVAAYFCTPEGEVVHAVLGNVLPGTFLLEAEWAAALAERLDGETPSARKAIVAQAHALRAGSTGLGLNDAAANGWAVFTQAGNSINLFGSTVHARLAERPLAPLNEVARPFFEALGETFERKDVTVVQGMPFR